MKRKYVVIQTVVQNDPEAVTKTICNPVSFPLLNQAYAGVKNPLQVYQVNLTFSQKVKIIHQLQVSEEFKLELLNHADIFMSMDALSFNQFENLGIFNKDGISLWTYLQKIKNEAILEGKETAIKATIKTPEWLKGVEGAEEMVEALGGMSKLCNIMADIKNNAPSINTIPTINFREQTKQVLDQMIKASVKPVHVPIWLKQQPIYRDIVSGNILTKDGYGKIPVNPIPKRHVSVSLPYGGRNPYLHDIVLGDIENMVIRNGIGKVVKQFGLIQEMEAKPVTVTDILKLLQDRKCIVDIYNIDSAIRVTEDDIIKYVIDKVNYGLDDLINKDDLYHMFYKGVDGNRTIDDIRTKLSDDYRYIPAVFNDDVRIMVISRNLINKLGLNYLGFDTKGKDLLHAIDNPIVKSKSYPVITVLDTDTALNFKYKCESDRETGLKKINKGIELFHMPDTDNTKEQVEDYNSICKLAAIHFGLKVSDDNIYYVSEAFIKEYLKDNNGTLHRVIPLNIEGLENVLPQHHILFTMHNVKVIKDLNNIKTIVGSTESLYCVVPGEIKNQEAFDHFINYFITRLVESDKNSTSTPNGDYKFIITQGALDQYFKESPYNGFEFSNIVRVIVNDKCEIEEC